MLFHSLAGSEMHGVIDEMDRRAKGDAPAISSAIDRGETETVGPGAGPPKGKVGSPSPTCLGPNGPGRGRGRRGGSAKRDLALG